MVVGWRERLGRRGGASKEELHPNSCSVTRHMASHVVSLFFSRLATKGRRPSRSWRPSVLSISTASGSIFVDGSDIKKGRHE